MIAFFLALVCIVQQDMIPEVSTLPSWVTQSTGTETFVVETEVFKTSFAASESLLPAIRTDVLRWAKETYGDESESIVSLMPLDEFESLIHENKRAIFMDHRVYDAETTERLGTDHADQYRGYAQIRIDGQFRATLETKLSKTQLKQRLGTTLVGAVFTLGALGIVWGYLFTSLKTRGFYIGRLRWIAGALACGLLLVCYAVSRLIF